MRSSTSRVAAEWTEASRKTAALFTHPESAPASSARSAALSAMASSETSPITEIARELAGWSSVQASVSGSSSMETTAFSSASSRSRSTIARPTPRPLPSPHRNGSCFLSRRDRTTAVLNSRNVPRHVLLHKVGEQGFETTLVQESLPPDPPFGGCPSTRPGGTFVIEQQRRQL